MGTVVDLQQSQLDMLKDNLEFVADLCRFAENILTEKQVRQKWHLVTNAMFDALGDDDELIEKVELEKVRRIRDGSSKREKAQLHVTRAPDVAAAIMDDPTANSRHRLDACTALNNFASNGPATAPAADRFIIHIDLTGSDSRPIVEKFNKSISINAHDVDPDAAPTIAIGDEATPKRPRGRLKKLKEENDAGVV